jgi:PAS domain S-box-containing protein
MKTSSRKYPVSDPDDMAVRAFRQSEQQLQDLLGGKVDSIMLQDGHQHFLRDAQEMLRQSESRFHNMFAASVTGMAISTPQGRFLEANAAYCRILGYEKDELLQLSFSDITHQEDLPLNLNLRDEVVFGRRDSFVMEKRYRRKDGGFVWVNHSVSATRTRTGEVATFVVIAEDITARKAAELRLNRLNRLHAVLSEVSEAIMRTRDLQELYDRTCRIVVERGQLRMAFIVEFDRRNGVCFLRASFGGDVDASIQSPFAVPVEAALSRHGVVGTVIETGLYATCNDMNEGDQIQSSLETTLKLGFGASAAFPFRINGENMGVLVLSAGEGNYFEVDEINLMLTVANNLSFGIVTIEQDLLRQTAEARSSHLAAIVEFSADAIISEDLDGVITSWNRGATSLFGYTAGEIVGRSSSWLTPSDRASEEELIINLGLGPIKGIPREGPA